MAKKKVNVALIGAQFMGKTHSNAWRKVGAFFDLPVEPVMKVICGRPGEDLDKPAKAFGWEETSESWEETVNRPDIDIIDICTPNALHPPVAIAAAKAGKHVICEKPLANTAKEAQDMLRAADKAGVKHMCAFSYRFVPAIASIKQMIDKGELGKIHHFRAAYQQDWIIDPNFPMVWRLKKAHTGSGALGDIGAHITDLCHYLIGDLDEVASAMTTFVEKRPVSTSDTGITASGHQRKGTKMETVDVDDAAVYVARIKGQNTLASFEATRFAGGRRNYNNIEIYGSEGSVLWNLEEMNIYHYYNRKDRQDVQGFRRIHATDPGHPYADKWWPTGHIIGYEHLFVHEIYEFVRNLNSKKATYPTFLDGVKCQQVLDAVEKADRTRKWEKVKY
jgi:predicted dehydrogenase